MATSATSLEPGMTFRKKSVGWSPATGSPIGPKLPRQPTGRRVRGTQFKQAWTDAEAQWNKRIKDRKLSSAGGKDINQIIESFTQKYKVETTEEFNVRKGAGEAISTTLSCVQLIGGLVAQGASMAFPPANMCFCAISFLIDIPKRIKEVYEQIGQLFVHVSTAVMSFKIYQNMDRYTDEIDPSLIDTGNKIMIKVVDICLLAIEMTESKWDRFKKGMKIAFLDNDSGVATEMRNLQNLCTRMQNLSNAVTLSEVMGSREDLQGLKTHLLKQHEVLSDLKTGISDAIQLIRSDQTERKSERAIVDRRDKIAKKLAVHRRTADDGDMVRKLKDASYVVTGEDSCKWLFESTQFQTWRNTTEKNTSILALEGPTKSGRTVLCSAVLRKWPKRSDGTSTVLPSFAYFAIEKQDRKNLQAQIHEKALICLALKSMAVQLSNWNMEYAKWLAEECEDKDDNHFSTTDIRDLWKKLHFSWAEKDKSNNFVLIFDGMENLPEPARKECLKWLDGGKIYGSKEDWGHGPKILLTGGIDTFKKYDIKTLRVDDHNQDDISTYVNQFLQKRETFVGADRELERAVSYIQKQLPGQSKGSFAVAENRLELIQKAIEADHNLGQIKKIIRNPEHRITFEDDEETEELVWKAQRDLIKKLNDDLNEKSIHELNELLIWTMYGTLNLPIDALKAAWYLRFKRTPVQSLKNKLQGKYKEIFDVNPGGYVLVKDLFWRYFDEVGISRIGPSDLQLIDSGRICLTISVQQGTAVRHERFIWNLQESNLEGGSSSLLSGAVIQAKEHKPTIELDLPTAHYRIAQSCLTILNDAPNKRTKALLAYAQDCLPYHLDTTFYHRSKYSLSSQLAITKGLIDLLSDVEATEKNWTATQALAGTWLENSENLSAVRDWLREPQLMKALNPRERRWVESEADESKNGLGCFWKHVTVMIGRQWLRQRKTDQVGDLFEWVSSFLALQKRDLPYLARDKYYPNAMTDYWLVQSDQSDDESTDSDNDTEYEVVEIERERQILSNNPIVNNTIIEPQTPVQGQNEQISKLDDIPKHDEDDSGKDNLTSDGLKNDSNADDTKDDGPDIDPTRDSKPEDDDQKVHDLQDGDLKDDDHKSNVSDDSSKEVSRNVSDDDYFDSVIELRDDRQRILEAAEWVKKTLGCEEDSIWHERLGMTYLHFRETDAAIKSLETAQKFDDSHWKVKEGLANAYARDFLDPESTKNAITLMQEVVDKIESQGISGDRKQLVENLLSLSSWHNELKEFDIAREKIERTLVLNPQHTNAHWRLIHNYCDAKEFPSAQETLLTWAEENASDKTSKLCMMLLSTNIDRDSLDHFDLLMSLFKDADALETLREAIQDAINIKDEEEEDWGNLLRLAFLYLFKGKTCCYRNSNPKQRNEALQIWESCRQIAGEASYGIMWDVHYQVTAFMAMCHFDLARTAAKLEQEYGPHLEWLKNDTGTYKTLRGSNYLGSLYADTGDENGAYDVFEDDVKDALSILEDDDPGNDQYAIGVLFEVFVHVRDDSNALTAWSLKDAFEKLYYESSESEADSYFERGNSPSRRSDASIDANPEECSNQESQKRKKPTEITVVCDGTCKREWTRADETWFCRFCPDTAFCEECKEAVRTANLKKYICSPDHEWFQVPPTSEEEYEQLTEIPMRRGSPSPTSETRGWSEGQNQVLMHIRLVDGKRVGVLKSLSDWLDHIREEWELDQPARSNSLRNGDRSVLGVLQEEPDTNGDVFEGPVIKLGRPSVSSLHSQPSLQSPKSQLSGFNFPANSLG